MSDPTRDALALAATEAMIRKRHAGWAIAAGTFDDPLEHPERECWGDLDRHALLVVLDNERALRTAPAPETSELREALDVERLATALHEVADGPPSAIVEFYCYCRRIATTDGTRDGPVDPNWSATGVYDPAEWGLTADGPTGCEETAAALLRALAGEPHD